jgi:hypothetical protein
VRIRLEIHTPIPSCNSMYSSTMYRVAVMADEDAVIHIERPCSTSGSGSQMKTSHLLTVLLFTLVLSCDTATDVPVEPAITGMPQTALVGSVIQLSARGMRAVTWSVSDSAIARISERGELRLATSYSSCRWVYPGQCTLQVTARGGERSATGSLTVLPYQPLMELNVRSLELLSGDSVQIRPRFLLEMQGVQWCSATFATRDPDVASVDPVSGFVVAGDSGNTVIEVHSHGPVCPPDPAHVYVESRGRRHVLSIEPADVVLSAGDVRQLTAIVRNFKGVMYPAAAVQWQIADTSIARINAAGVARANRCTGAEFCRTVVTARSGRLSATASIAVSRSD